MSDWFSNPAWWIVIFVGITCALTAGNFLLRPLWKRAIDKHAWEKGVDADRKNFKEFMKEIRDDIKAILGRLPPSPTETSSPMKLTDLGVTISGELSVKDWAERTAPQLIPKVRGRKEFEIFDICMGYVKDNFKPGDEQDMKIREVAYQHGIKREKVLDVFAVELRDRLLMELGINQ